MSDTKPLGRCTGERSCCVRFTSGRDAVCVMHADTSGDTAARTAAYRDLMDAPARQASGNGKVVRGTGKV